MSLYKVEICGVNTAKLPLLNNEEKKNCLNVLNREIRKHENSTLKAI